MTDFRSLHLYARLVRRGLAEPMLCSCGTEYVLSMDLTDYPVFKCFPCGSIVNIGSNTWEQVSKAVKENFDI